MIQVIIAKTDPCTLYVLYHRRRSIQGVRMKKESAEAEAPDKVLFCFNLGSNINLSL
jgi:hypothetical protein